MTAQRSVFTMTNVWFFLTLALFAIHYGRLYPAAFEVARPFALLSLTVGALLFLSRKDFIQWKYPQMQAVWFLIGWMLIGIPFALNYGNAFMTTRNVMMFLPFMLSIIVLINDVKKLRILVNVILFVAILNAVRGFLLFDGPGRNTMINLGAFLGDPNDFSLYLNMMIPFAYFMFLQERRWNFMKLFYGLTLGFMIAMVVMTFSRGGMVGLVAAGVIMWWFSPNRAATFALGMLALIGVFLFSGDGYISAMSTTTDLSHSTIQHRFTLWSAALNMFIDHPIMGVGVSNVPFHIADYVQHNNNPYFIFVVAHSIWFTVMAEGGLIGAVLFGWLIFANWSGATRLTRVRQIDSDSRYLRHYGAATLASMVAFLASGSFLTVNYYPHIWYLTAMIVVGIKILNHHHIRYDIATKIGWFNRKY